MKKILLLCLAICLASIIVAQDGPQYRYIKNRHTGRMDAVPYYQVDSIVIDIATTPAIDTINFPAVRGGGYGFNVIYSVNYVTVNSETPTLTIQHSYADSSALFVSMNSSIFPITLDSTGIGEQRVQDFTSNIVYTYNRVIYSKGTATTGICVITRTINMSGSVGDATPSTSTNRLDTVIMKVLIARNDNSFATAANTVALVDSGPGIGHYASNYDMVTGLATKQATLVSTTNIKTINSTSILGAGDIAVATNQAIGDSLNQFNIYYVDTAGNDSNNGLSPETAWETITKVNSSSYVPGNKILFKSGQTWRGSINPSTSGKDGKYITYGSYGTGAKPMISANTYTNSNLTWVLRNNSIYAAYVPLGTLHIKNVSEDGIPLMAMKAYSTSGEKADIVAAGQWVQKRTVDSVYVRTTTGVSPATVNIEMGTLMGAFTNGTDVLTKSGEDYLIIDGLNFQGGYYPVELIGSHIIVKNCFVNNCYGDAIKIEGSNPTGHYADPNGFYPYVLEDIQLYNNNIFHFGEQGIDNTGGKDVVMKGNDIHHGTANRGFLGDTCYNSGILIKNNVLNCVVEGNKIHDFTTYAGAISIGGQTWTGVNDEAVNCRVSHNLIYNISTILNVLYANPAYIILFDAAKECSFLNNTITNCTVNQTNHTQSLIYFDRSDATETTYNTENPIVKNNIFWNNSIYGDLIYTESANGDVSGLTSENNLIESLNLGTNSVVDSASTFETGTLSTLYAATGVTQTITPYSPFAGTYSLKLVAADGSADRSQLTVSGLTIDSVYYFEFYTKIGPVREQIVNSTVFTGTIGIYQTTPLDTWTKITRTFTATAESGVIRFYAAENTGAAGDSMLIDNVYLSLASAVSGTDAKFKYENVEYTGLGTWRKINQDLNSITSDPTFTSATDFSLQTGSSAINVGANVNLSEDLLNNPIIGKPDLGAIEKQ